MPTSAPDLRRGRIVWAMIADRNGIEKERPVVILTPTQEIAEAPSVMVAAITTTFKDPPPDNHIELPWHARGHPVTRLKKRSAVVVNWLARIDPTKVLEFGGDVPKRKLNLIDEKLAALSEDD